MRRHRAEHHAEMWSAVGAADLERLARARHLRGFAVHDEVFLWDAYEDTHAGMMGAIGIVENEGIAFFVRSPAPRSTGQRHADDPDADWSRGHRLAVGGVEVVLSGDAEELADLRTNRAFCRMVGWPVPREPRKPRPRFDPETREWMARNGWDDASADAYLLWSQGAWPWDSDDLDARGEFPRSRWEAGRETRGPSRGP